MASEAPSWQPGDAASPRALPRVGDGFCNPPLPRAGHGVQTGPDGLLGGGGEPCRWCGGQLSLPGVGRGLWR